MLRICSTLARSGYKVSLIGVSKKYSLPLTSQRFEQKRIPMLFQKGPGFYMEYNIKLVFYLLFKSCDTICCIDLDTMLPVYIASAIKGKKRIYDAHEYFSQLKEVVSRPKVYRIWHWVEKTYLPRFKKGYTVSQSISDSLRQLYKVNYETIRNVPFYKNYPHALSAQKNIIYQGAVNEARGLESLIPAMKQVNAKLIIYGDGNFAAQTKALIEEHGLQGKVLMKGMVSPAELETVTSAAYVGINLVENNGLNQYYSLANKFFDYIMHSVPQVTMNFPEYTAINNLYEVAVLVNDIEIDAVAKAINSLLNDDELHRRLKNNCAAAAQTFNWQNEEKKLLNFYKSVFE